jgi:hypothetical protein
MSRPEKSGRFFAVSFCKRPSFIHTAKRKFPSKIAAQAVVDKAVWFKQPFFHHALLQASIILFAMINVRCIV